MSNWCNNVLRINPTNGSKKSLKQLRKFVYDIAEVGEELTTKQAKEFRKKFLKDNLETRYRDAVNVFVTHSEMSIFNFMQDVCYYKYHKDIDKYINGAAPFVMQKLLPVPLELLNQDLESHGGINAKKKDKLRKNILKKYGISSEYDWRIANYGTKWDLDESTVVDDEDERITYSFDTAWTPPVDFLKNICEKYPLLTFELNYEEPGCDFEGDLVIVDGEIITDETRGFTQTRCNECGEELGEGEEFDEEGNCPVCHHEE